MLFDRQKRHADGVLAGCGQGEAKGFAFAGEKLMWNLDQQPGTVTGFGVAATSAAMCQVDEDLNSLLNNLMTPVTTNTGDKTDAAGVMLMRGVIKTLRRRQAVVCFPVLQNKSLS